MVALGNGSREPSSYNRERSSCSREAGSVGAPTRLFAPSPVVFAVSKAHQPETTPPVATASLKPPQAQRLLDAGPGLRAERARLEAARPAHLAALQALSRTQHPFGGVEAAAAVDRYILQLVVLYYTLLCVGGLTWWGETALLPPGRHGMNARRHVYKVFQPHCCQFWPACQQPSEFGACGSRMQAGASAVRVVLAGIYGQLGRPLPLSFSLGDGPIALTLLQLDWKRFEEVIQK